MSIWQRNYRIQALFASIVYLFNWKLLISFLSTQNNDSRIVIPRKESTIPIYILYSGCHCRKENTIPILYSGCHCRKENTILILYTQVAIVTEHILTNLCTHFVICEINNQVSKPCMWPSWCYKVSVQCICSTIGSLESSILVTLNL